MKTISQTCDIELIRGILSRDNIYSTLVYDGSPSLNQYVPTGIWFLLLEGEAIAGMINIVPLNNILYQPHIFIFEQYRGGNSHRWAQIVMSQFPQFKFMAITPYESARNYAKRAGFKEIGIIKNSILKNGKLLDQYILES